jgi:hypothetical protein
MTEIFCIIDDFCKALPKDFEKQLGAGNTTKVRQRSGKLSLSEMMTILILFQSSGHRNFKGYYLDYICRHCNSEFPGLISYSRFVYLMPRVLPALSLLMLKMCGETNGIAFVDSTTLTVCHNKRVKRNRVFAGIAKSSKSTMGWFFGFKLHLVINDCGEIISFKVTQGNVDDRKPLPGLAKNLWGKLFGDKGYLSSELSQKLAEMGVTLITSVKKNMKNKLMPLWDKIMLRKRFLIETVNDQLKNQMQIEHTRHRSPTNFLVNLMSGLLAYSFKPKKPSLNLQFLGKNLLIA